MDLSFHFKDEYIGHKTSLTIAHQPFANFYAWNYYGPAALLKLPSSSGISSVVIGMSIEEGCSSNFLVLWYYLELLISSLTELEFLNW